MLGRSEPVNLNGLTIFPRDAPVKRFSKSGDAHFNLMAGNCFLQSCQVCRVVTFSKGKSESGLPGMWDYQDWERESE